MEALERKKLEVRKKQIHAIIAELELKVEILQDDIKRVEDHIEIQKKLEIEINEKLKT